MIMDDALPGFKSFFRATPLKPNAVGTPIRPIAAFTDHLGRMFAAQATGPSAPRHGIAPPWCAFSPRCDGRAIGRF